MFEWLFRLNFVDVALVGSTLIRLLFVVLIACTPQRLHYQALVFDDKDSVVDTNIAHELDDCQWYQPDGKSMKSLC